MPILKNREPVDLDIPEDELQQFRRYLRVYRRNEVIIREGDLSDVCTFLLRQGEIQISKQMGGNQQVLGKISAVNFFGEMAVVLNKARTATVVAADRIVAVYAFPNLSISALLANPKWGMMLVRRMADSMNDLHAKCEQLHLEIDRLRAEVYTLRAKSPAVKALTKTEPLLPIQ